MSAYRPKPRRHLRHDVCTLLLLLAVPAAILLVFPYPAVGLDPAAGHEYVSEPSCAFIRLDDRAERYALGVARVSWRSGGEGTLSHRPDLSVRALPPAPMTEVIRARSRSSREAVRVFGYEPPLMPPTLAAGAPSAIPASGSASTVGPAFPREELLKLQ